MRTNLLFSVASRQLAIELREACETPIHASAMRGLSESDRRVVRGYVKAMKSLTLGVKK